MPVRRLAALAALVSRRARPQRTLRTRLTVVYGGLFLVSGAGLLAITYLLVAGSPPFGIRLAHHPSLVPFPRQEAQQRAADLHELLVRSGIALGIMTVVSIWLGWHIAGRVLRPLRVITATTRHISEDNLHQRLGLRGPGDEIRELGDTIDGLLGRLEGAFDAQRSFVANASHELRTPLTMMRTSLDVAAGKSPPVSRDASVLAGKVREGLDQADRLLESFLVLARAQRGVMTDLTTVSLAEIAAGALDVRHAALADRDLQVRRTMCDAAVTGSRTLLARMVANIIDNAVRHNETGGIVDVLTEVGGTTARLIVESGGPVLDHEAVSRLGQPFQRLSVDRTASDTGVGLGLSIVVAVVAAHSGTLDLSARPEGGLRVVIELPHATLSRDRALR